MTTLEDLKLQAQPYLNTLVLSPSFGIFKLKDVIEYDDDYCWVFINNESKKEFHSCLIKWIPLNGFIKEDDYKYLTDWWNCFNDEKVI